MPSRSESLIVKYLYPVGGFVVGFGGACLTNYFYRRPYLAGIQKHILYGLAGITLGYYTEQKLQDHYAERDAMIRHYMELHPEDFVVEKKKYRDIFEPWPPHR